MRRTRSNGCRAGPRRRWALMNGAMVCLVVLAGCGREPDASAHGSDQATPGPRARATVLVADLPPAPRPTGPLEPGVSCVTAECHTRFATAANVHSPVGVGRCDACHEPDAGGHTYPLTRPGNATCTFCHDPSGTGEHLHAPMADPGCTACHDPHAAPAKFLLPAAPVSRLCESCHDVPLNRYAHGPVADGHCTLCHQPHRADNPRLLRGGSGIDHCATCHGELTERLASAKVPHPPANDCAGCHAAHTSPYPGLLSQPVNEHCGRCHADAEQEARLAAVQHQPVFGDGGCASCHDPHGSAHDALLADRADRLCADCHAQTIVTEAGERVLGVNRELSQPNLHGPVRDGDCAACHNVHGAPFPGLLTQRYPERFYAAFELADYELCFSCHEADLVLHERTTALTGFRDGDVNLHYLHVNRGDRGRTCRACHAVHGSSQPLHVAEAVPYQGSDWMMPIGFEKTEDGGSCAPGCHEPMSYRRGAAVAALPGPDDPTDPPPTPASAGGAP